MKTPVRLGVSPAATSIPTGVFNERFEALFPHAGTLAYVVCLAAQLFLPVYLHANVGLHSPQSTALPASHHLAHPGNRAAALP